jgi:outer membrane protein OmpA-like peptidoglycan-associated protein
LNVGVNYYFKTSNGTHHFLNITECDQREIDALNNTINSLRDKNAADQAKIAQLQAEIARLQKALRDCENKPAPEATYETPTIPSVFYNVNKSLITKQQAENVAVAAQILKNHPELKLNIKGYASPEGKAKKNQELSVRRANAVKDLLVKKYGIDESRITAEGCGTTKDKYETYENNRVAMLFFEK